MDQRMLHFLEYSKTKICFSKLSEEYYELSVSCMKSPQRRGIGAINISNVQHTDVFIESLYQLYEKEETKEKEVNL